MKISHLLVVVVSIFLVVGCSGGKSLDGKWNVSGANTPPGAKLLATFSPPDKLVFTLDMEQPIGNGKNAQIHADIVGTYKVEGENLTIHADDVKFSATGIPEQAKALADAQFKALGDQTKQQINKDSTGKLTWVDNDKFAIAGKVGNSQEFTRVK